MTATLAPTLETVKTMLIDAYTQYDAAYRAGDRDQQMYFDGMIRGLRYVMEASADRSSSASVS